MNIGKIPAKTARLAPRREAVIDPHAQRRITYGEFDERVAILARNCIEVLELILACARCGLIAQPLNWRLSTPELLRIVRDGEPRVIAASPEYADTARALAASAALPHKLNTLTFSAAPDGSYEALLARSAASEPDPDDKIGGSDPALILYTGGTTGQSKGALHSHHSLYIGMLNQTVAERVVVGDVYMLTGQMFHIPVALAMNYMAHGCPVVLINFEARLALELIQRERFTAFLAVTTMLNWMLALKI